MAGFRAGRPHRRARRGRQLLVHGRHRALRPVLGDPLLPRQRPALQRADLPGPGLRLRPVRRDLEQRLHGVRPAARRRVAAAAQAVDRHRHGARAHRGRQEGHVVQLRHRRLRAAALRHRRRARRVDVSVGACDVDGAGGRLDASGRRPPAGDDVSHRRRRVAEQRVARLRAAQDHAARDAARQAPGVHRAGPSCPRRRADRPHGRCVPRIAHGSRHHRAGHSRRGAPLRRRAHQRPAEARRAAGPRRQGRDPGVGRRRVPALRHAGPAAGLHRGPGQRAQAGARSPGLRPRDGGAAREGARQQRLRGQARRGAGFRQP